MSAEVVVCPKLEELVIEHMEMVDIKNIIRMAAARASRGAKLKSVRIVSQGGFVQIDVLELKKHVLHVECAPGVDGVNDDTGDDNSDEED
jgi:hypothetical protein